jgi:CRP/FNR family transcriptional regulator, cyclic AMP receptor protein
MSSSSLEFALLRDLDDAARRTLIAACTPRRFARREVVFHEGDPGDCLHLVVSGRFAVRVTTPRGDAATLRVIGAGEVFGELVLLDRHARRIATVLALEPSSTLTLARAQFAALRSRYPQIDRVLTATLAANVARLSAQVLEALYVPVDGRVARRLVQLADVYGAEIPLTQDDLAGMAGTTRATANAVLRRLADRGVLTLARGRILVVEPAALRRAAG